MIYSCQYNKDFMHIYHIYKRVESLTFQVIGWLICRCFILSVGEKSSETSPFAEEVGQEGGGIGATRVVDGSCRSSFSFVQ